MKYQIEAVISTGDYSNITPRFDINSEEDEDVAIERIKSLTERFGKVQLKDKTGGGVKVTTFTGEEILWNEATHTYTDLHGNVLRSGSQYANENSPKFDLEMMLPKTAAAWDVPQEDLRLMWKYSGDIANHWGSAVHMALDVYHKYNELGAVIQEKRGLDMNYVMPKNSYLRKIVQEFVDLAGTDALCEVLVSDVANKMAGTIDRIKVTGDKTCRVQDYKTNNELDKKKLLKYQKQMSYYAHILTNKGWKVEGLDLYYLNADDGWSLETLEVLPLE
jgi:hypothetical protein